MAVDVLICNLTRFGDLIQMQPLLADLHGAGLTTGLVCLQNFTSAAGLLKHISMVWPFPAGSLLSQINQSWPRAIAQLLEFVQTVSGNARPRHVLNLTPSVPARMLAFLIAGEKAQLSGFGLDQDGYALNSNVWASFLAVAAGKRTYSPFNVADMMRNTAGELTKNHSGNHELALPGPEAMHWAKALTDKLRQENKAAGLIAFQPGASEDARRWPTAHFAKLGQILWEKLRLVPVLTGASNETSLVEEYSRAAGGSHPFFSAIGKTDFQQLAALLRQCELLVTNDTGTMHLAAGQGCHILAFFLATAQVWDTAPLQPGSCCLEPALPCHPCAFGTKCDSHKCRTHIQPEAVAELILNWRKSRKWQAPATESARYRLWLTDRDSNGMTRVLPQGGAAEENRSLWLALLRDFWSQTLDRLGNPHLAATNWTNFNLSPQLPADLPDCVLPTLESASQLFASMVELGAMAAVRPEAGKLLLKNSSRVQQILDECGPLATIAHFWRDICANKLGDLKMFLPLAQILSSACSLFREALHNQSTHSA